MKKLNVVAKWGGNVIDASVSIFLSICLSFCTLNSSRVLWLSLRRPSLSFLLLQFLMLSLGFLYFSCLCHRFHFECHSSIYFFCTGCSFHFAGCNFYFHSFFLKNGSPHGDKFSSCDFSVAFLLCLTSIYVESVFVTRAIIGSFLSFSDGVW